MRTNRHPRTVLIVAIASIAIGGCSSLDNEGGAGGAMSAGGSSGGATSTGGASGGATGQGGGTGTGGATVSSGGSQSGGAVGTGGEAAAGGRTTQRDAGASGGAVGTGGRVDGAVSTGGATGGRDGAGGRAMGGTPGIDGGSGAGGRTTPNTGTGTCTASKGTGKNVAGTGPHKVVIETSSDAKAACGTIYRPQDLGGAEKYPIFVWGEGGCSRNGLSNQAAMGEIASHGYFVIADGPAGSAGNCGSISMSTDVASMAKVMIGYIDWAIAENEKSCSAYYQSLDTTKIAADGFSCGGLMAMGTAGDPRMTAVGQTSSGLTSAVASYYKTIHTPFKILLGGSGDVAYENGMRDYDQMSAAGIPVILFSKNGAGHGGDLANGTGDFNSVNLAWLNWQLKGDTGATGKGALVGSTCKYCSAAGWEYKSKNIP